jgi:hypothetical protein
VWVRTGFDLTARAFDQNAGVVLTPSAVPEPSSLASGAVLVGACRPARCGRRAGAAVGPVAIGS